MRKIVLYIAASLDGYIARPDGGIDWLENEVYKIDGEDFGYSSFMKTIDTTLMGHSTYKVVAGFDMPFPYPDKTNYVFTHSQQPDNEFVHFISSNAAEFVRQLKQQPGKDIWLIGGSQLNTLLLNAGLIDEIILTYIPIILGNGIPLFAPFASEKMLNVKESKHFENGFVQLLIEMNNNGKV
ncbi:dihydrofolate reductase [Pontibacter sp. KCTC 32443]|uniref:dihydrofolate reductase family protein n=1 Tax=Pontibacter TaxID=323449 RepID=UPI00164EA80B|nr:MULTISPECIES: dihydrofolate reductase family protein [Pontibacter]MBC5774170.1 dihydrofolate reductase [Pontibacter sp. KCTC 32443]